jgi:broad specificity phosphatase PhoE
MAMRLIAVRHCETGWNRERRFQGWQDSPLSDRGRAQADAVSRALSAEKLGAVYASPLGRAVETAEAIARPHGLSVVADPAFKEMCFGAWEGLAVEDVKLKFPDDFQTWRAEPHRARFGGPETVETVQARTLAGLEALQARHDGQAIVVVSHSIVVRLITLHALGLPASRLWTVTAEPAGITEIEYRPGWTSVHRMNTQQHLEGALAP